MNKDIQALIEREAEKYNSEMDNKDESYLNELSPKDEADLAFKAGASFALSLFKWRKVSEGLPEETGWNKAPYLVKTKYEIQVVGYTEKRWHLKGGLCIKPNMVTEWMPIPNND